jgi:hypothetical protein
MQRHPLSGAALLPATNALALPEDLIEAARDYARAAHARGLRASLGRLRDLVRREGPAGLPASAETVAVWMAALPMVRASASLWRGRASTRP